MIKRKDLSQVYYLNNELQMWEAKLKELQISLDAIGSPSNTEATGVHGTKKTDRTAEIATSIADTQMIINGIKAKIRFEKKEVIQIVEGINDSLLRQIVMYRCYDLKSWADVAILTGSSEYSVKHMYYRAFPK